MTDFTDPGDLVRSPDGLDAILGGVSDGVTVQDATGALVYANPAGLAVLGIDDLEALRATPPAVLMRRWQLLDEQGSPLPVESLPGRRALSGEATEPMLVRYRSVAGGGDRFSIVAARPIRDSSGAVRFVVNTFHDVTELKRSELSLRFLSDSAALLGGSLEYEETLRQVARLAVPGFADWCVVDVLDEQGGIHRVSAWHRDPEKRDLAAEFTRRYPPERSGAGAVARVLQTGRSHLVPEITDEMLTEAAADRPDYLDALRQLGLRSSIIAPLAGRAHVLGALTMVSAESERRYTEQDRAVAELLGRRAGLSIENARLYREASQAVDARDTFLSMATHELLTPITVVRGYAQSLARFVERRRREQGDSDTVTLDAGRLLDNTSKLELGTARLTRLIDELLDVSRIQRGVLELTPETVDLAAVLRNVVDAIRLQQSEGRYPPGIDVELSIDNIDLVGTWDPIRLEQVLFNVLDNAVKYSPKAGRVEVSASRDPDGVVLTVVDQGIGIPADQLERVFEPFGRAANAAKGGYPGFGMGLSISREIVQRHGGAIVAESNGPGSGTRITIRLPTPGGEDGVTPRESEATADRLEGDVSLPRSGS